MLYPAGEPEDLPRKPLEMVFTLDVSGSMAGQPIEQAQGRDALRADAHAAGRHVPDRPASPATPQQMCRRARCPRRSENIARGAATTSNRCDAGGGTMMLEGMRRVARLPARPEPPALRRVPDRRLHRQRGRDPRRDAQAALGDSAGLQLRRRQATNRYLLDHMAKMGAAPRVPRPERQRRRGDGRVLRAHQPPGADRHRRSTGAGCR